MQHPTRRRRLASLALIGALTGALGAGLAACSDNDAGGSDSAADPGSSTTSGAAEVRAHNDADVAFAQHMVPHHQQALEMVDLTQGRTLPDDVRTLVDGIAAAQAPEIATMTGWLTAWGEPSPSASGGHAGHDMGDMGDMGEMDGMDMSGADGMPGMMTDAQMAQLEAAPDADFTRLWLQMMIEHHRGAVEMARTELEQGEYPPAIALAQSIIDSQTTEIRTMQRLLG